MGHDDQVDLRNSAELFDFNIDVLRLPGANTRGVNCLKFHFRAKHQHPDCREQRKGEEAREYDIPFNEGRHRAVGCEEYGWQNQPSAGSREFLGEKIPCEPHSTAAEQQVLRRRSCKATATVSPSAFPNFNDFGSHSWQAQQYLGRGRRTSQNYRQGSATLPAAGNVGSMPELVNCQMGKGHRSR